jgi:hypothetical protein
VNRLQRVGAFWYDFLVGDDWRLAVGAVVGIAAVDALVRAGHQSAWWLLPVVVAATLISSLRHATREARTPGLQPGSEGMHR